MSHRFKVGDRVCRARVGLHPDKGVGEIFAVARLMPEDQTGEPSYRVRTETGERAMRESELIAVRR